jgi:Arc/MetJ-type ribon-helix-helix transcriptional regulator
MAGKVGPSEQITCRISPTLKRRCESLVSCGEYCSLTDLVEDALQYYINRKDLRRDLIYTTRMDAKLSEKLYSPHNEEFLVNISEQALERVAQRRNP